MKVKNLGKLTGVERIGAGEEAAYAVGSRGKKVAAWGSGGKGQLGDGETEDSASPVRTLLEPASPVVEIVGGRTHALARLANGELYAWGADGSGQLGFETGSEPDETCGRHACSDGPRTGPSLDHVVALAAGEGISFAVKEEENAAKVIYSSAAADRTNCSASATSTSRPRRRPPRSQDSARCTPSPPAPPPRWRSSKAAPGACPAADAAPSEEALTPQWNVRVEPYKLRYRPVGTREFGKTQEGNCKGPCSLPLTGLKAEPYEVILKSPEGREGHEKTRRIIGTPKSGKSWPANTSAPTISGKPAHRNGETAPRPDAHRLAGNVDEQPHPVHLPVAALRRLRRSRRLRRTRHRMRTDHGRQRPCHRGNL